MALLDQAASGAADLEHVVDTDHVADGAAVALHGADNGLGNPQMKCLTTIKKLRFWFRGSRIPSLLELLTTL